MTSQTGEQTITIHILPDNSRSKCNRNIFLEKSCTNCGGETSPGPSLKNQN